MTNVASTHSPSSDGRAIHVCVSGAKSRTHLVYIASYLHHLLADPGVARLRVSLIEAPAFLAALPVEANDLLALLGPDPRLVVEAGMPGWRFDDGADPIYVAVGAVGVGPWARLRRHNGRRSIDVVVTDEGIGTYGSWQTRRAAMKRQGVNDLLAALKPGLTVAATKAVGAHRWPAYVEHAGVWSIAPDVAEEFQVHLDGACPGEDATAVILTQPFVDMGAISADEHMAYVRSLAQAASECGLKPIVRPHPAEDASRYEELTTLDVSQPAELDPRVVRASAVIGGPSTALVNLSAMFGAQAVWVSEPGLERLDTDISSAQQGIFKTFLGQPVTVERAPEAIADAIRGA